MSSLKFSRWFTVSTALVLAVAAGVIVKDRTEPRAAATAQPQLDADQLLRLRRIETQLALSTTARPDSGNSRVDMEARLAALQSEMDKLQQQLGNRAGNSGEAKRVRTEHRPDPVEEARTEQERTQLRVASLENAMLNEPLDVTWSSTAAAELSRGMMDPGLAKTRLGEVRCASTLCRIDVSHATREAEQAFMMQLTQIQAFQDSEGLVQHQERADGSLATIMYVSRSGHPLPSPPQS